jgi:hypothetical protein
MARRHHRKGQNIQGRAGGFGLAELAISCLAGMAWHRFRRRKLKVFLSAALGYPSGKPSRRRGGGDGCSHLLLELIQRMQKGFAASRLAVLREIPMSCRHLSSRPSNCRQAVSCRLISLQRKPLWV